MKTLISLLFLLSFYALNAQESLPDMETLEPGWNNVAADGVCSAGTPFNYFVKNSPASSDLLIFFNGGGACWFGEACDLQTQPNIHFPFAEMPENDPNNSRGIFDASQQNNPFAEFDMVFIPYCTGDVHLGGGLQNYEYTTANNEKASVAVNHNGYQNTIEVLDWVFAQEVTPSRIVVAGSSAGAIAASFYSGLVAEHFPESKVTMIADAAGGYASPLLFRTHTAWNTETILPSWQEYAGKTNANLTFEDYAIASKNHNQNLTIAQYNAAEDETQIMFTQVIGDAPGSFSLPQRIMNNHLRIESEVDEFFTYTAGGDVHMILQNDNFYHYEVEGTVFADWVGRLIDGRSPADVSCVREPLGCSIAPNSED